MGIEVEYDLMDSPATRRPNSRNVGKKNGKKAVKPIDSSLSLKDRVTQAAKSLGYTVTSTTVCQD
jgi:hypothetical protein